MSAGEMAYLGLVISGFLPFIVVLGWVSTERATRPVRGLAALPVASGVRAQST